MIAQYTPGMEIMALDNWSSILSLVAYCEVPQTRQCSTSARRVICQTVPNTDLEWGRQCRFRPTLYIDFSTRVRRDGLQRNGDMF